MEIKTALRPDFIHYYIILSSNCFEKHFQPDLRTNLGDHGNHGTQWLLSIGVVHNHLFAKVAEKLAIKQNA